MYRSTPHRSACRSPRSRTTYPPSGQATSSSSRRASRLRRRQAMLSIRFSLRVALPNCRRHAWRIRCRQRRRARCVLRLKTRVEVKLQGSDEQVNVVASPIEHPPPFLLTPGNPSYRKETSRHKPTRNDIVKGLKGIYAINQPVAQTIQRPAAFSSPSLILHAV